jgi:hypothetical protein
MRWASDEIRNELHGEMWQGLRSLIETGELTKAISILQQFNLTPADMHAEIGATVSALLGDATLTVTTVSCRRLLALGAWSLIEPGVIEHIVDEDVRARFLRYRGVFGDPSPRELEHLRRYELLDRFLVSGVPVFSATGFLREENLEVLGRVLPSLIREAGGSRAWTTHGRHLATLNYSSLHELGTPAAVERELQNLIEFYRMFHGACAPTLYAEFRADTQRSVIAEERAPERLVEWRASFESEVLSPRPDSTINWDAKAVEYLDAWTRSRGVVQERQQSLVAFSERAGDDLGLKPRTVVVRGDNHDQGERGRFAPGVTQGYRALTDVILSLQRCDGETILSEEKVRVHSLITQHLEKLERWLGSDRATEAPSWVSSQRIAEVEHLKQLSDSIEKSTQTEELVRLLLKVEHKLATQSVVRLSIAEALRKLREPMEFFQLLETEPSVRSIRALGEFISNQLFDEVFEALNLSKSERKAVKKALPSFDPSSGLRAQVGDDHGGTLSRRGDEEIRVYPTRGVLAEFAGSFADACWTDKVDLMGRYPNAVALVFVSLELHDIAGADKSSKKIVGTNALVGACYLLTVKDMSGADILVIRGLNPRERPFERLSIESFIEGLLDDVVVPYARELGAKKIVIPFDELGHAQTNRLRVGLYLEEKYGQMPYVPLDPKGPNTNFNDRRIFDKCRLVRDLS